MKRRDFGKMVLGTGVASAIPVAGMAGQAAAATRRSKYIFAVALAHNRVDISAEMISDTLSVRPTTARHLMSKLVKNGVVDAPNISGIARLAKPLQRIVPQVVEYNPAGGYLVKGPLDRIVNKATDMARSALKDEINEASPAPTPEDPEANIRSDETFPVTGS